jgi:hypothetical protein
MIPKSGNWFSDRIMRGESLKAIANFTTFAAMAFTASYG